MVQIFFFSPFPQIISHQREHNGPVENNLPPSATVTLVMSDTIGGRELWQSLWIVLSLQALEEPHLPELVQQVLPPAGVLLFIIIIGNTGSNNCHLAACKCNLKNKQPWQKSFPGFPRSALTASGCHAFDVTQLWPLTKNTWPLLLVVCSRSWGRWWGVYLFGRSLVIQPTTLCFEGQELSIRTLIS